MTILYEDNHLVVVNKAPGELVQADRTGDPCLRDTLAEHLAREHNKPGRAFVGVVHRLDRPVGGVVVMAKTSKALARLNDMFSRHIPTKTYWAIVPGRPPKDEDTLTHWLASRQQGNKTYIVPPDTPGAKEARLHYRLLAQGDRYSLLEIQLLTGRKHQIRAQLSAIGLPIRGDLKYGAPRSLPDGSISLLARRITLPHPVAGGADIDVTAPLPDDPLWQALYSMLNAQCSMGPTDQR